MMPAMKFSEGVKIHPLMWRPSLKGCYIVTSKPFTMSSPKASSPLQFQKFLGGGTRPMIL